MSKADQQNVMETADIINLVRMHYAVLRATKVKVTVGDGYVEIQGAIRDGTTVGPKATIKTTLALGDEFEIDPGQLQDIAYERIETLIDRCEEMDRNARQDQVEAWVRGTFGDQCFDDRRERALRFLEEAIELVQSLGLNRADVANLAEYVFGRPVGLAYQEFGGVSVTLLGLAQNCGVSLDRAERVELTRILVEDPDHFRRRHDAKCAEGVGSSPVNVDVDDEDDEDDEGEEE